MSCVPVEVAVVATSCWLKLMPNLGSAVRGAMVTGFLGCPTPSPPWGVWLTFRVSDTVGAIRAVLRSTFFSVVAGVMEVACCCWRRFRYFSRLAALEVLTGPVLMILFCCSTVDVVVIISVVVVISASASAVAVVVEEEEEAVVVFNVVARPAVILFALPRSAAFPLAVKFFVFFVMVVVDVPAAEIC